MKTTPERHTICADFARRAAERLEAGARDTRFTALSRLHYAAMARVERLSQAYHEEAARLAEQGIAAPGWIEWLQARGI